MSRFDDETLMRRADGELSPTAAQAVDSAAAADPEIARRLEAFRMARREALSAFPAEADARDADLMALIAAAEPVLAAKPVPANGFVAMLKDVFSPRRAMAWGTLATAAFVAGVIVAPMWQSGGALVGQGGDVADPALVRVLDQRLAEDGPDIAGRAVGLTFVNDAGQWCRTFTAGDAGVAGLACRHEGNWSVRALAPFEASGGEIRTAASDLPASVMAAVDDALTADPVDAADEARARDAGWASTD